MSDKSRSVVNGPNAILAAGVLAILAVIYGVYSQSGVETANAPSAPVATVDAPQAEPASPATVPDEAPQQADATSAEPEAPDEAAQVAEAEEAPLEQPEEAPAIAEVQKPAPEPVEIPLPQAPGFDVVRIDPQGNAVIAGSAEPEAEVRLLVDGEEVTTAVADRNGKFVALFDLPPSERPRSLSAELTGADGTVVASNGAVLIAATRPVQVAEAEPVEQDVVETQTPEVASESASDAAEETEETVVAQVEPEEAQDPVDIARDETVPVDVVEEEVETQAEAETTVQVADAAPAVPDQDQIADAIQDTTEDAQIAEVELNTTEEEQVADSAPEPTEEEQVADVAPVISDEGQSTLETPDVVDSPTIVLADNTGVRVLQPAPQPAVPLDGAPTVDGAPEVTANLVIDTITYDTEGEVALAGRGAGASFARVYLNDRVIQTVKIGPDGTWRSPLPDVDAGVYRLRIDEVTAQGDVTSRVETPFQREEPEVAAISAQRPNAVTVQEGFTLWAIAKDRFGEGREYVRVYEANRDLIRDPDLIYPGQVFELPEG